MTSQLTRKQAKELKELNELLQDPNTSWRQRLMKTSVVVAAIYDVAPPDALNDAIPFLGRADDFTVWLVMGVIAWKLISSRFSMIRRLIRENQDRDAVIGTLISRYPGLQGEVAQIRAQIKSEREKEAGSA